MRISLNASVCTVKRLRVSLGTLVAIEATASATADIAGSEPAVTAGFAPVGIGDRATGMPGTTEIEIVAGPPGPGPDIAACETVVADTAESAGPPRPHTRSRALAEAAIEQAFRAIEQVNRLLHPRAADSDLARINSAPLHVPTKVHPSVGQLLNLARRINILTGGVFDPCTPAEPGRLNDIEISADETEIVCRKRVALDLGGFAKGYAVDCAIEALMAAGCTAGLVNAGGDLRVFGQRTEPVFVRGRHGELTNIELTDAALAVSDAASEQRPPEHQGYYGAPALVTPFACVIAPQAVIADALSKCVLLCRKPISDRALQEFNATRPLQ